MSALTTVLRGVDFGEAPRWRDGLLWFSDFYRQGVFTLDSNGVKEVPVQLRRSTVRAGLDARRNAAGSGYDISQDSCGVSNRRDR